MLKRKYFGTDGIRGRVGCELMNPEFVLKLGWAAGMALGTENRGKVLIGKDTRVSGYILESVLEAGLASAGIDVRLLGPMPTPAIAYLTRAFRANAGIVISASHNPFYDNGIKFFGPDGTKLPDEIELKIEEFLDAPLQMVDANLLGKVKRYNDAPGRYIEFCKSTFGSFNSNLAGMKIVLDCANGATYHIAGRVFSELEAEVIELNVMPDGFNINKQCGSTDPKILQEMVLAEKADLGIAFDGDGDRVILVDNSGKVVDGDEILFVIAKYLQARNELKGGVVGTIMSNFGLEKALQNLHIDFLRAKVGDRYIVEELKKQKWVLGGEPSGHILHLGISTTGDGIIAALQILAAIQYFKKSLNELVSGLTKIPQKIYNAKTAHPKKVAEHPEIKKIVQSIEHKLGNSGRVVLRPSGTEPIVRVMVESEDESIVDLLISEIVGVVEQCVET
jgi:phosphoglucosamine mutase